MQKSGNFQFVTLFSPCFPLPKYKMKNWSTITASNCYKKPWLCLCPVLAWELSTEDRSADLSASTSGLRPALSSSQLRMSPFPGGLGGGGCPLCLCCSQGFCNALTMSLENLSLGKLKEILGKGKAVWENQKSCKALLGGLRQL